MAEDEQSTVALSIKRRTDCVLQGEVRDAETFGRTAVRHAGRVPVNVDLLTIPRLGAGHEIHVAAAAVGQAIVEPEVFSTLMGACDRWSALVVTVPDLPNQGRALAALVAARDGLVPNVPVLVIGPAPLMAIRAVLGRPLVSVVLPAAQPAIANEKANAILSAARVARAARAARVSPGVAPWFQRASQVVDWPPAAGPGEVPLHRRSGRRRRSASATTRKTKKSKGSAR